MTEIVLQIDPVEIWLPLQKILFAVLYISGKDADWGALGFPPWSRSSTPKGMVKWDHWDQ